jgi:hypothetical protein
VKEYPVFKDDTCLETVMYRYKLGLDHVQLPREFDAPDPFHPSWIDRFLFNLGKHLIALGSRLQQRHTANTPPGYRPAYPAN